MCVRKETAGPEPVTHGAPMEWEVKGQGRQTQGISRHRQDAFWVELTSGEFHALATTVPVFLLGCSCSVE